MTVKLRPITWHDCSIDSVHLGVDDQYQAHQTLEEMLLNFARKLNEDETLYFPTKLVINLEAARWSAEFIARVEPDYNW